jgi:putative DNA methylase
MAVYTRYAKVLDASGEALGVRAALALIIEVLDETLTAQEGDFDADTRWATVWFDDLGFAEGEFGRADDLARAKNTAVDALVRAGIVKSGRGKVRLLRPDELDPNWDPATDARLTVWETVHQLVARLGKGESAAADLVGRLGAKADTARELAYRLYAMCERKKRSQEALAYNSLVQSWPEIVRLAGEKPTASQGGLFG